MFFNVQHLLQNGTHLRNFLKNYFTIWIDRCSFGYVSITWVSSFGSQIIANVATWLKKSMTENLPVFASFYTLETLQMKR